MGNWFAELTRSVRTSPVWTKPVRQGARVTQGQAYVASAMVVVIAIAMFAVVNRASAAGPHRTAISLNGANPSQVFQGIGAISGGGGNSRLLIDYPEPQRSEILDYLFKPGYGADLQILKLEIGGDAYATDGAEPSFEQTKGHIDCNVGYEFWLAEQAQKLDPHLQIYGLQWNAPHWIGGAWSNPDIGYLLDWLNCAKTDGLTISYLGGWNEHLRHGITPQVMGWFIKLRAALNAHGYGNVQIAAVDSFAHENSSDVSNFLAAHPKFAASISILGYHNLCRYPATGKTCLVPKAARMSGKPIWESEIGALRQHTGVAAMTRSIDNAFVQVGVTGLIEWPLLDSMPAFLPEEDRGLVFADEPWTGQFHINLMTWVLAQTTQFTAPGWRHIRGGSGKLGGAWGSYTSYESPDHSQWSLNLQTTDAPRTQTITVHVASDLPRAAVHVWATNVKSLNSATWFIQQPVLHPSGGSFSYQLKRGYIYTFTNMTGQGKGSAASLLSKPMPMPYKSVPDPSGEPRWFGAQDGSFQYLPGQSKTFAQTTVGQPIFWQNPVSTRFPYGVVGDNGWRNYTVSVSAMFTKAGQSAGLITRFDHPKANGVAELFHGYQFVVSQNGTWRFIRNAVHQPEATLATGHLAAAIPAGTWFSMSVSAQGTQFVASINGKAVATVTDHNYVDGGAGISTGGWYKVEFRDLTVAKN
jgi:hypothetical protein